MIQSNDSDSFLARNRAVLREKAREDMKRLRHRNSALPVARAAYAEQRKAHNAEYRERCAMTRSFTWPMLISPYVSAASDAGKGVLYASPVGLDAERIFLFPGLIWTSTG